jgi:hypothetical protein
VRPARKPLAGGIKYWIFLRPTQHDIQHGVVRDENVGSMGPHVLSQQHLSAKRTRDIWPIARADSSAAARGDRSIHLCRPSGPKVQFAHHPLWIGFRGLAGVTAKVVPMSVAIVIKPSNLVLGIQHSPQANHLILDQGVHGIKDETPSRCRTPGLSSSLGAPFLASFPPGVWLRPSTIPAA